MRLDVGDLVKVQCFLAYISDIDYCIYFTAEFEAVEAISKVKVVVNVL